MEINTPFELVQTIVKVIFKSRYIAKIDTNFNIEGNYIKKRWKPNQENQVIIQFFLKTSIKSYLVEEWNIIASQGINKSECFAFVESTRKMTRLSPMNEPQVLPMDHTIVINEKKRTDWLDPNLICSEQILMQNLVTVNVAYLENLQVVSNQSTQDQFDFTSYRRDRFLSDDIKCAPQYDHHRKQSFYDVDTKRSIDKNKQILKQVISQKHLSDSHSSTSSKNQQSSKLLSIFNKKDDFEILSNVEDAQKIIDLDEDGDFEIEMIIDERPIKSTTQTIIIKEELFDHTNLAVQAMLKLKNKQKNQGSQQIRQLIDFMNMINSQRE